MSGLMTMPKKFQYGEMPQNPLQIMQSLMMQGQGPMPSIGGYAPPVKQTPVDIFNSLLGQGAEAPSQPSATPQMTDEFDVNEYEKARLEYEAEKLAAARRQENNLFALNNTGAEGTRFAQAPQAQSMPLQSLMQMAMQRG